MNKAQLQIAIKNAEEVAVRERNNASEHSRRARQAEAALRKAVEAGKETEEVLQGVIEDFQSRLMAAQKEIAALRKLLKAWLVYIEEMHG